MMTKKVSGKSGTFFCRKKEEKIFFETCTPQTTTTRSMSRLRLGSFAPDFTAESTHGLLHFHKWAGDSWVVLFSHPGDFTPVCTTELAEAARLESEFTARNVKLIALSVDSVDDHFGWIKDINEFGGVEVKFPLLADHNRKISLRYEMLDQLHHDPKNISASGLPLTVRSVFVIDPYKKIRLVCTYPATCGRNFSELLRAIDSLQLTDSAMVKTPVNWKKGDKVIVHPDLSDDQAKKMFGNFDKINRYLRYTLLKKPSSSSSR